MDQKRIGQFIAELRKQHHMTQEQLSQKLGVSKWERGLNLMDMSLLKPLSDILEVNVIDILSGEIVSHDNIKNQTDHILGTIIITKKKMRLLRMIAEILQSFGIILMFSDSLFTMNLTQNIFFTIMGIFIFGLGIELWLLLKVIYKNNSCN